MTFTEHYDQPLIGKTVMLYLSNRRNFIGVVQDVGESFIRIDGIDFNTEHIISLSIQRENK
jgi:hypothetical protein